LTQTNPAAIVFESITKRFPLDVVANDHISFAVERGTIHALLGENGAGKTTLLNILYGIYQPTEGSIRIHGKRVRISSPQQAISLGIGMVHQLFKLVDTHTVAENVILGLKTVPFAFPLAAAEKKIKVFSENYGLKVDPRAKIWQLSAGQQQRVEILKALFRGADILVLDEPTSVLTPAETDELFSVLNLMKDEGKTIVFISHKLDDVVSIADRVTILRRGRMIETCDIAQLDKRDLAEKMVGRQVAPLPEKTPPQVGKTVLEVKALSVLNDKGVPALKGVSFDLAEGEILGVAGVSGNGQRELAETLTGLRKAAAGKVIIGGDEVTNRSPRTISQLGVAHIPEDRAMGLVDSMNIAENLRLKDYLLPPFAAPFIMNGKTIEQHAQQAISKYNILPADPHARVQLLSGGNRQRVVLAREFSSRPRLIIAAHPTAGLDIAGAQYIHELFIEEQTRGAAILLISEDLEEIMSVSDRILVMFDGQVMGSVACEEAERTALGLWMAGISSDKAEVGA